MSELSQAYLKEILHYDSETGVWTWRVNRRKVKPGQRAALAPPSRGRCRQIRIDGKLYRTSRLAWLYMKGEWPKAQIDHKNRNPSDDRFDNLREATNQQNCWNKYIRNTSGFKGVRWCKANQKWDARIAINGKSRYLGYFLTKEQAAAAYREAALRLHGGIDQYRKINGLTGPTSANGTIESQRVFSERSHRLTVPSTRGSAPPPMTLTARCTWRARQR